MEFKSQLKKREMEPLIPFWKNKRTTIEKHIKIIVYNGL